MEQYVITVGFVCVSKFFRKVKHLFHYLTSFVSATSFKLRMIVKQCSEYVV